MRIENLVDDEVKRKLNYKPKRTKKKRKQKYYKEKLSRRDIEELMGVNRNVYKRGKGGALRSK